MLAIGVGDSGDTQTQTDLSLVAAGCNLLHQQTLGPHLPHPKLLPLYGK